MFVELNKHNNRNKYVYIDSPGGSVDAGLKIVEEIQKARVNQNGLIINAGGYTHTSIAIHDALKILKIPIIELHITNIYNREEFRHKSLISKTVNGVLCGFGVEGYIMAIQAMKNYLKL